jgi:hypothetical protein
MTIAITIRIDRQNARGMPGSALAPELFKLDEVGNAQEAVQGCIPHEFLEKAYIARTARKRLLR